MTACFRHGASLGKQPRPHKRNRSTRLPYRRGSARMPPDSAPEIDESAIYRKVTWRLIPVLFSCYILAYIDRVNVGFAKLAMKSEPWFSEGVFATGAGVFFVGYFLFE